MINTKEIYIKFSDNDVFEDGIIDIRKTLSNFVTNKKASLYDLSFLCIVANYYMGSAVISMNKKLDPLFDPEDDSPLLDTCAEFMKVL